MTRSGTVNKMANELVVAYCSTVIQTFVGPSIRKNTPSISSAPTPRYPVTSSSDGLVGVMSLNA